MLISGHDRNRALMNQPLRIGLIGAGMVSRHHLIAWASLSDQARVVAVADPSGENAARRASEFEIPQTWASAEAMLAECELDAIDIAAPREMHAPLVRLAAAKRLPVLCQKPLAPNLQEATDLAAEVDGVTRLMVHENWRFRGYYRDAAAWLREGRIGNIKQAQLTCSGVSPQERIYDLATEYQGSYNRTIAHFVQSLRDNTPFETAPQDNLETLRLVEDCYRLSGWEALP